MQVRYETEIPIAQKGKNGKTTVRKATFLYDQPEWHTASPLPPLGYNIGFKNTNILFVLERAAISQNGNVAHMFISPTEPLYSIEVVNELIVAGFCVLEKDLVCED